MPNPYNISIHEQIELSYLNLDFDNLILDIENNPLLKQSNDPVTDLLNIIRNPLYLPFTAQYIFGLEDSITPTQHVVLLELLSHTFPMLIGSRGFSKTWILAFYILYRLLINQSIKVVVVGAAFRQSKLVAQYCETIWNNAPVLRDLCGNSDRNGLKQPHEKWIFRIGESTAVFLPMGDGSTIRGERANIIIADEFSMINAEVYEQVVKGFGAVSKNPVKAVKQFAKIRRLKELNLWNQDMELEFAKSIESNQSIISGTAFYSFNVFAEYWKKYRKIIEACDDQEKIKLAFEGKENRGLKSSKFTIIRIPYELIPEGFLDADTISHASMMSTEAQFNMEFHAIFPEDSSGFFRRKLIELCTPREEVELWNEIILPFSAQLIGKSGCRYVMAVDPASEHDNFCVVILECYGTYRKIVHCWTSRRDVLEEKRSKKLLSDQDFFKYCAKKIRELHYKFPCDVISIDAQGGGYPIMEALRDTDKLQAGELPFYPVTPDHQFSDGEERPTDRLHGLHIIEIVQPSRSDYVSEANHMLKKDLQDRALLFPYFDSISLVKAGYDDSSKGKLYDSLEDCMLEIEYLKDELTTINHDKTPTGKERWSTPEVRLADNRKARTRKDRYSALLMANMAARRLARNPQIPLYLANGGFAGQIINKKDGPLFYGPDWFTRHAHIGGLVNKE